jgi:hypothetical protein
MERINYSTKKRIPRMPVFRKKDVEPIVPPKVLVKYEEKPAGHNDELTRKHWRDELANVIYQMYDVELVRFMRERPGYAERLRAALNEPEEIEG